MCRLKYRSAEIRDGIFLLGSEKSFYAFATVLFVTISERVNPKLPAECHYKSQLSLSVEVFVNVLSGVSVNCAEPL